MHRQTLFQYKLYEPEYFLSIVKDFSYGVIKDKNNEGKFYEVLHIYWDWKKRKLFLYLRKRYGVYASILRYFL